MPSAAIENAPAAADESEKTNLKTEVETVLLKKRKFLGEGDENPKKQPKRDEDSKSTVLDTKGFFTKEKPSQRKVLPLNSQRRILSPHERTVQEHYPRTQNMDARVQSSGNSYQQFQLRQQRNLVVQPPQHRSSAALFQTLNDQDVDSRIQNLRRDLQSFSKCNNYLKNHIPFATERKLAPTREDFLPSMQYQAGIGIGSGMSQGTQGMQGMQNMQGMQGIQDIQSMTSMPMQQPSMQQPMMPQSSQQPAGSNMQQFGLPGISIHQSGNPGATMNQGGMPMPKMVQQQMQQPMQMGMQQPMERGAMMQQSQGFVMKQGYPSSPNFVQPTQDLSRGRVNNYQQIIEKSLWELKRTRVSEPPGVENMFKVVVFEDESGRKMKRNQCCFCNKMFAQRSNMIVHIRIHTGEKPYACQICSRAFAQKSNLKRHMRVHVKEQTQYQPMPHAPSGFMPRVFASQTSMAQQFSQPGAFPLQSGGMAQRLPMPPRQGDFTQRSNSFGKGLRNQGEVNVQDGNFQQGNFFSKVQGGQPVQENMPVSQQRSFIPPQPTHVQEAQHGNFAAMQRVEFGYQEQNHFGSQPTTGMISQPTVIQ